MFSNPKIPEFRPLIRIGMQIISKRKKYFYEFLEMNHEKEQKVENGPSVSYKSIFVYESSWEFSSWLSLKDVCFVMITFCRYVFTINFLYILWYNWITTQQKSIMYRQKNAKTDVLFSFFIYSVLFALNNKFCMFGSSKKWAHLIK